MIKVYIASPYSKGNRLENVRRQIDVASQLIDLGYNPFWPLNTHFVDELYPKEYELWLRLDFEWLHTCNCLLRLTGESPGADREVIEAYFYNIPIFYSIEELHSYWEKRKKERNY